MHLFSSYQFPEKTLDENDDDDRKQHTSVGTAVAARGLTAAARCLGAHGRAAAGIRTGARRECMFFPREKKDGEQAADGKQTKREFFFFFRRNQF